MVVIECPKKIAPPEAKVLYIYIYIPLQISLFLNYKSSSFLLLVNNNKNSCFKIYQILS